MAKSTALRQLHNLQRSLYERAWAEAHSFAQSPTIVAYSDKFESSLPNTFHVSDQNELLQAMRRHRYVLYGDFHTLKQSQRGLLRILRAFRAAYPKTDVVLAMEMFRARDQAVLNDYMEERKSDEELHEETDYAREWGFPWKHYKMILDLARMSGVPVIGINSDSAGRDSLSHRDQLAARCLVQAGEKFPDAIIVCMVGEYHLADRHLPAALEKEIERREQTADLMRILCNVDRYFFEMRREGPLPTATTEYLRLKEDTYCILNCPPWIKWQSYAIWEEMRGQAGEAVLVDEDDPDDDGLNLYTEETFDTDYHFLRLVKSFAEFLGVESTSDLVGQFHIHTSVEADFFNELHGSKIFSNREIQRIIERASRDGVYFVPATNTILFTEISINNMAEAAGQYLHRILTNFTDEIPHQPVESFYRRVIKFAVGMVASKILNPKRKGPDLKQFKLFVEQTKRQRLTGYARLRRKAAKAVLKHHDWIDSRLERFDGKIGNFPKTLCTLDRQANYEVSSSIGRMLGSSLITMAMGNQIRSDFVRTLFSETPEGEEAVWQKVRDLYEQMGDGPRSSSRER